MSGPALEAALAPFRAVAPLLHEWLPARALALALENGLAAALVEGPCDVAAASRTAGLPPRGAALLLALLGPAVARNGASFAASAALRAAWPHRDLLRAKLDYAALALPDLHLRLGPLLGDTRRFMAESDVFALFRYDRALADDAASRDATARWVALTTALSRHEAPVLAAALDWSGTRRLLDMGGNSGETARWLCIAAPALQAVVADLPAVCALGRAHLAGTAEAARIGYHAVDLRQEAPPCGFDTVLLKSVLHDWPPREAARLLRLAADALEPSGRLVLFERASLPADDAPLGYGAVPDLLFHAFYRDTAAYRPMLEAAGLVVEEEARLLLDMPFLLLTARRPPAPPLSPG